MTIFSHRLETILACGHGDYVVVTHYPAGLKAFYMYHTDTFQGKVVVCYDVLSDLQQLITQYGNRQQDDTYVGIGLSLQHEMVLVFIE